MVFLVLIALIFCAFTILALRPVDGTSPQIILVGFDGISVIAIFAVYIGLAVTLGDAFAISALIAFVMFEMGRVLANRVLSRDRSTFRLVPFLTRRRIHERPFRSEHEAFFFALMGSGFSLAPMVLALTTAAMLAPIHTPSADFLLVLGATIGAFNFLVMLPFPPLAGGTCARIAARNFWPALGIGMTVFMVAALASAGIRSGSLSLMVLAGAGLTSLAYSPDKSLAPMGHEAGLLGLAAYTFTMGAHFTAGWMLFTLFL